MISTIEDLTSFEIDPKLLELVSSEMASTQQILPIKMEKDNNGPVLVLGFSGIDVMKSVERLSAQFKVRIHMVPFPADILSAAIAHHYGVMAAQKVNVEIAGREIEADAEENIDEESGGSVITDLVNLILRTAVEDHASDIHLLPSAQKTSALLREDGELFTYTDKFNIGKREHRRIINKIKTMCKPAMDIAQRNIPQDGAFSARVGNQKIDCRVNTMPTVHGEKLNIRLFDVDEKLLTIDDLGLPESDVAIFKKTLIRPSGMILVAAPTGEGKSTTIHAMLRTFDPEKNIIIAIEDPVEERIGGVAQVQVKVVAEERMSLSFAKALRACMRQDPNILEVGEIRDTETAQIAISASQTGHVLLSTVHARDSISAMARVFEMGIPRGDFLREMICTISQRLVGVNCPHCSEVQPPEEKLLELLLPDEKEFVLSGTHKIGKGCPKCLNRGFWGRIAVAEHILFDNEVRDYLAKDRGIGEIIAFLREKKGYVPMWEKGLQLVHEGKISLNMLIRRVAPDR